jgi:hypothetical protein
MAIDELLLLSGNDIPINEINLLMHCPTIKEIAFISEEIFFSGCEFLKFNKNKLTEQDKNNLENLSNFEIIMAIMKEKNNPLAQKNKTCALMVLSLLFPTYKITIEEKTMEIILEQEDMKFSLNKNNYDFFVTVLNNILCLGGESDSDYNPSGNLSKQIAEKFKDRQAKLASLKENDNQKIAILSRYVSILAVGENKDINVLLNYTIYQLFDEFQRFQLKQDYDMKVKSLLAGAKKEDVGEIQH